MDQTESKITHGALSIFMWQNGVCRAGIYDNLLPSALGFSQMTGLCVEPGKRSHLPVPAVSIALVLSASSLKYLEVSSLLILEKPCPDFP